jgi:hypothetical protein
MSEFLWSETETEEVDPAPTPPSTWGPEWIVLPYGKAIHRDDLSPCAECENPIKTIHGGDSALLQWTGCHDCCRFRNHLVKDAARILGTLDTRTGVVTLLEVAR